MIKNYEEAMKYIFDVEITRDYSLEKVKLCAQKLGNPQYGYKTIHITGTNGKGSTCNMCFSILKKRGKKVGIFTSPHLLDIRERFKTTLGLISKQDFVEILNKILDLNIQLSYFEYCTLIAFEYFKKIGCEYAVIEVGMGGLLDSTNIVDPEIVSVTSIGYDHMELLGSTLEEIAFQKAGIIKPNKPVVINYHNETIEKIAKENNSQIIFANKTVETNLIGDHQKKNASLAYEICKYIGVPEEIILSGLQEVEHKGRLQYIQDSLLIDGAHNEQGLESLQNYLSQIQNNYKKIIYCFSTKKGKNIRKLIIDRFGEDKEYVIVNQTHNMLEIPENIESQMLGLNYQIQSPQQIQKLAEKNKEILYVVFGSLYMIGGFY